MPGPQPKPLPLIRNRIAFRCSVAGCRVLYTWVGQFRPATSDGLADDKAAARLAATLFGWQFPEPGNRCPRHREKEPDARDAAR